MTTFSLNTSSNTVGDATVLEVSGVLDSLSYLRLRDEIIKAALDHPSAVVIDVNGLHVPTASALAVFTSARWHISRWPDTPLMLVHAEHGFRDSLRRNGVTRYVPVYDTVGDAVAALPEAINRRRVRAELPADPGSAALARELIAEWLAEWSQLELLPIAKVVATVFVENGLRYTEGPLSLRLESDGERVTIAVEDNSRVPAAFHEGPDSAQQLSSLKIVDVLCQSWGSNPIPTGKAVWAVIAADKRP